VQVFFIIFLKLEKLRGATPKVLDGSTFESLSPEELLQAEEDVRRHELDMHPNNDIQFACNNVI
jgi:hypothetical protein